MSYIVRLQDLEKTISGHLRTKRGTGMLEVVIYMDRCEHIPPRDKDGIPVMPIESNRHNRNMSTTVHSALALGFTHARLVK